MQQYCHSPRSWSNLIKHGEDIFFTFDILFVCVVGSLIAIQLPFKYSIKIVK
jgi:hypothetical protein